MSASPRIRSNTSHRFRNLLPNHKPGRNMPSKRRLYLESLEDRRLLSVSGLMDNQSDLHSAPAATHGSADFPAVAAHVQGQIIVGFDGDVASTFRAHGAEKALEKAGKIVGSQGLSNGRALFHVPAGNGHGERVVTVWNLGAGVDVLDKVNGLTGVAYAEPNGFMTANVIETPTDPAISNPDSWEFGYQEHIKQIGAYTADPPILPASPTAPESGADAWFTTQGDSIVIAVVDTGVDLDHPDLNDNLFKSDGTTITAATCASGCSSSGVVGAFSNRGEEVSSNGKGGVPGKPGGGGGGGGGSEAQPGQDDAGHGTHVAGIIAAEIANIFETDPITDLAYQAANDAWAGGTVGVAPQAKIMPVKVLGANGSGAFTDVADGIVFAAEHGADIINMSLGGGFSQAVSDAIWTAYDLHDVLVISSAGNGNADGSGHPAANLYSLSIAAVDSADERASFSNYGFSTDIAAPGVSILSTFIDITTGSGESGTFTGAYGRISGTSMAAPVVSGVAALIMAAHPTLSADAVASQLLATAANIDAANPGFEGKLGAGRVDALVAVGTLADPTVIGVSGLGVPGGTIADLDVGDAISVQFSHVMNDTAVKDGSNYKLLFDANNDTVFDPLDLAEVIPLAMLTTTYDAFPGRGVELLINGVAPDGKYELNVNVASSEEGPVTFTRTFTIGPEVLTTEAVAPLGSLVYEQTSSGLISGDGDTDSFTVNVDAGQTIAVQVIPNGGLEPSVSLNGGVPVTGAAGENIVIQATSVSVVPHTITVGGVGVTTGGYTVRVILNAAIEEELNNTLEPPQNITASFVNLGGGAQRGAVLGSLSQSGSSIETIEDFDDGNLNNYLTPKGRKNSNTSVTAAAAHDGDFGLQDETNTGASGWIYRDDIDVFVEQGDVYSIWVRSDGSPTGRAYAGFGASETATLSIVMAPNTNQFMLQRHTDYGYEDLGAVSQSWLPDHWYRMEVSWEVGGDLTGRLYDSNGTTLLNTVTGSDDTITTGGLSFRAFDSTKHFDTVQVNPGAASAVDDDVYQFTLGAGETATVVATAINGGALVLEHWNGTSGVPGVTGATNVDSVISITEAGTHSVRVTGDTGVEYSLVVTIGAVFDLEDNNDSSTAQDITNAPVALGHVGAIDVLWVGPNSVDWNDGSYDVTQIDIYQMVDYSVDGFAGYDVIYVDTYATVVDEVAPTILAGLAGTIETFVVNGGGLITDNGGNAYVSDFSWVPNADTLTWIDGSDDAIEITLAGQSHDIMAGLTDADLSGWNAAQHNYFGETAGMDVLSSGTSGVAPVANALAGGYGTGDGKLVYFGLNPSHSGHQHGDGIAPQQLIRQAITWAAGANGIDEDWYTITLAAGEERTISIVTPGSGDDEFVNTLEPGFEVNGSVFGDADTVVLTEGTYTIRVFAESNSAGEYILGDLTVEAPLAATEAADAIFTDFDDDLLSTPLSDRLMDDLLVAQRRRR